MAEPIASGSIDRSREETLKLTRFYDLVIAGLLLLAVVFDVLLKTGVIE